MGLGCCLFFVVYYHLARVFGARPRLVTDERRYESRSLILLLVLLYSSHHAPPMYTAVVCGTNSTGSSLKCLAMLAHRTVSRILLEAFPAALALAGRLGQGVGTGVLCGVELRLG